MQCFFERITSSAKRGLRETAPIHHHAAAGHSLGALHQWRREKCSAGVQRAGISKLLMIEPKFAAGDQCPNQITADIFNVLTTGLAILQTVRARLTWASDSALHEQPIQPFARGLILLAECRQQTARGWGEQTAQLSVVEIQVLRQTTLKITSAIRGLAEVANHITRVSGLKRLGVFFSLLLLASSKPVASANSPRVLPRTRAACDRAETKSAALRPSLLCSTADTSGCEQFASQSRLEVEFVRDKPLGHFV